MVEKLTFQAKRDGGGVRPDSVRARDLAEFISNLESAIIETAKAEDLPLPDDTAEAVVSLIAIGEGSHLLTFAVRPSTLAAAGTVASAIATRQYH